MLTPVKDLLNEFKLFIASVNPASGITETQQVHRDEVINVVKDCRVACLSARTKKFNACMDEMAQFVFDVDSDSEGRNEDDASPD